MIVGAALVELRIHGSQSLKAKRGVVRSIVRRVRNHFNLSVAEVGEQDTWQRAVLGIAVAGSDEVTVRRVLEKAIGFIEDLHLAELAATDIQVLHLPEEEAWDPDDQPRDDQPLDDESEEA